VYELNTPSPFKVQPLVYNLRNLQVVITNTTPLTGHWIGQASEVSAITLVNESLGVQHVGDTPADDQPYILSPGRS